jgi:hypothetical protein
MTFTCLLRATDIAAAHRKLHLGRRALQIAVYGCAFAKPPFFFITTDA